MGESSPCLSLDTSQHAPMPVVCFLCTSHHPLHSLRLLPLMLQLTGSGVVPLSRARCCRPCLPSQLPDSLGQLDPHLDPQGVAIVSIGCHRSTGQGSEALKCEPQGSSFVTGFTEAIRVSNAANYYYPVGAVECCTPSVLLSTGDAWELERCDCSFSTDINCGEQDTNRLLQGFERWRSVIHACYAMHWCHTSLCVSLCAHSLLSWGLP